MKATSGRSHVFEPHAVELAGHHVLRVVSRLVVGVYRGRDEGVVRVGDQLDGQPGNQFTKLRWLRETAALVSCFNYARHSQLGRSAVPQFR